MGRRSQSSQAILKQRQMQDEVRRRAHNTVKPRALPKGIEQANGQTIVYMSGVRAPKKGAFERLRENKFLVAVGMAAIIGVGFAAFSAGKSDGEAEASEQANKALTTCESFKQTVVQPGNKPDTVEIPSDIQFPAANESQPDLTNVFEYALSTDTTHAAFAGSCALYVTVSLEVDQEKFAQTQFAQYIGGGEVAQDLKIGHLFNMFNSGIKDTTASSEARQASYDNCMSQIDTILSGLDARPELFSENYFQPAFLRQSDPVHPRTRMDYAPYPKPSYRNDGVASPAWPSVPFQEIWLQDEEGGAIICSSELNGG